MKVLVVEDYAPLRNAVCQGLTEAGYVVESAEDGQQAMWRVKSFEYDVVLLDLMIPHVDGLSILSYIRDSGREANVLVVTAKDSLEDRVTGLNLGADDYLVKPFEMAELLARVEALLRRSASTTAAATTTESYKFGDVSIDFRRAEVTKNGVPLELSAREFKLLRYFIEHRGAALSRDELLNEVWGYNAMPSTRTVDVHIAWLRQKIEDNPRHPQLILTVHGLGYKFAG